jgi:hypothetical protein
MELIEETQTGPGDPVKGSTSTKVDNTPLFQANTSYLQDKRNGYNQQLSKFITEAFQASRTLPKVNGKPIASIDQLPTLIDKYGHDFYEQAKSVLSNPDISDEQAMFLIARQKKVDDAFAYTAQASKVMYDDIKNAASTMDAKMKVNGWHSLILSPNGQFKGPTQARKDIEAFKAQQMKEQMEAWRKANPMPERGPLYWQRTDMPNPMQGQIAWVDGKPVMLDSRPKMANSVEGYLEKQQLQQSQVTRQLQNLNYDDIYKRVLQEYNKNPKTRKIKAAEENIFNQNAGGAKATLQQQEYRFDVDNYVDEDERGNMKLKPEMEYTVDLLKNITKENPKILFAKGSINDNPVIPSGSDVTSMKMVQTMLQALQEDLLNVNRTKGSKKRFAGSISFVPVAGGDENYHAYHIQPNSSFFDDYIGTKENPGIARGQNFINSGITVFVPVEESGKMKIGAQSIKGTKISPVEGMIGLSEDNSFSRRVDDAMEYKISLDKNANQYVISGNMVVYNPETAKMDTVDINKLGLQSRYDLTVDIDNIDKQLFKLSLNRFQINRDRKRKHSEINGVRDPKQLSGN